MKPLWSAALAATLAASARAATITGTDYGGADLHPVDGDVLVGTFTNVGNFIIDSGATVYTAPAEQLSIYAATVTIQGTLDASGRGQSGGNGGATSSDAGTGGFAAAAGGSGLGGAAGKGGGGGADAGAGGIGSGSGGGTGGTGYGATGAMTAPISADDLFMGSGGGGGGGAAGSGGGSGAAGGGAIYIEASSMTLSGAILADGATAAATTSASASAPGGAGGGGGGGTILLRVRGPLYALAGSTIAANGGPGGNVVINPSFPGTLTEPGGGGGGGRLKIFSGHDSDLSSLFSVALGTAGGRPLGGSLDSALAYPGALGATSFGVVASSATSFAESSVYVTSVAWTWTAAPSFGDGANPAYRIFTGTATAPLTTPEVGGIASSATSSTETALTPNTTYYRFVTAYTDWGDGLPSNGATAYTLADVPAAAAAAFSATAADSLTFAWTSGAAGNPSYTQYEISRSTSSDFAAPVSTSYVVGLSSAAGGLSPNTTYYFRARAVNVQGVLTDFSAVAATATLAAQPSSPGFGTVFVTSASFVWGANGNPGDTEYVAQLSTDNFFSVNSTSQTLALSATFFSLTPGTQLYFRVLAVNRDSVPGSYSVVVTTKSGNLSDTTPPSTPGTPVADRQFSYDGTLTFAWTPASSSVGILDYDLIVGTLPGASDVGEFSPTVSSFSKAGLPTGRTIYAQVRARSNAGVYGSFSSVSAGVPVFNTQASNAIAAPYNWPNPFDPREGPTQIGFFMEQAGAVTLKIYTLQGRLVHEDTRDFSAGNQIETWSGSNDAGSRVSPGGYIVMLQKKYPDRVDTQKLKVAVLY